MNLLQMLGLAPKPPAAQFTPTGGSPLDRLGIAPQKPIEPLTTATPSRFLTGKDEALERLMAQLGFPMPERKPRETEGFAPAPSPRQMQGFAPAPAPREVGGFSPLLNPPQANVTTDDRGLLAQFGLGGTRKNETPADEMVFYRGQMVPTNETAIGSKRNIQKQASFTEAVFGGDYDKTVADRWRKRSEEIRAIYNPLKAAKDEIDAAEKPVKEWYDKLYSLEFNQRPESTPPEISEAERRYNELRTANEWDYDKVKRLEELQFQLNWADDIVAKYGGKHEKKTRQAQIADENSDLLFLTTQRENAESYANQREVVKGKLKDPDILFGPTPDGYDPIIYEMRGKFDKVFDITKYGERGVINWTDLKKMFAELGLSQDQAEEVLMREGNDFDEMKTFSLFRGDNLPVIRKALNEQGYDSVHYTEGEQDNWIVLDRSKVRQTGAFPLLEKSSAPKNPLKQLGLDTRTK